MKKEKKAIPTDAELEILEVLWKHRSSTVRDIHDILSAHKKCAYTTTLKIIQKMTVKGLVKRAVADNVHTYTAAVEESKVRSSSVKALINKFFGGSYAKLAMHALGESSKDENIDDLIKLVNDLKRNKK